MHLNAYSYMVYMVSTNPKRFVTSCSFKKLQLYQVYELEIRRRALLFLHLFRLPSLFRAKNTGFLIPANATITTKNSTVKGNWQTKAAQAVVTANNSTQHAAFNGLLHVHFIAHHTTLCERVTQPTWITLIDVTTNSACGDWSYTRNTLFHHNQKATTQALSDEMWGGGDEFF